MSADPFVRVFRAYRHGIIRKPDRQGAPGTRSLESTGYSDDFAERRRRTWDGLFFHLCIGVVPVRQRLHYRQVTDHSFAGLLAAREGRCDEARQLLQTSRKLLKRMEEGPGRTMAVAFMEGNAAYLDHRLGRPDKARAKVRRALDADLALELDFDLTMYEMHRVQLGHNLARVDLKLGRPLEALRLCGQILAYLEGLRRELPYHHDWLPVRLVSIPRSLVRAMFVQVASETIQYLVSRPSAESWSTFLEQALPSNGAGGKSPYSPRLWRWLQARQARRDGDLDTYLSTLEEVLFEGPKELASLFYAMLVDFVETCASVESANARKIHEVLVKDSAKWKGLPPAYAARLAAVAC
jgi:tetratricopeptide (TPR) repeat protein